MTTLKETYKRNQFTALLNTLKEYPTKTLREVGTELEVAPVELVDMMLDVRYVDLQLQPPPHVGPPSPMDDDVVRALESIGGAQSLSVIRQEMGEQFSATQLRRALKRLTTSGRVKRSGKTQNAVYSLPEAQ